MLTLTRSPTCLKSAAQLAVFKACKPLDQAHYRIELRLLYLLRFGCPVCIYLISSMLAHRWLNAAWLGRSLPAAPKAVVRLARSVGLSPHRRQQQQQSTLQRLHVACAAGLQVGKPYSASAKQKASSFEELSLIATLLEAMKSAGLSKPTEIQVCSKDQQPQASLTPKAGRTAPPYLRHNGS